MVKKVVVNLFSGVLAGLLFLGGYSLGQSPYAPVHLFGPRLDTPAEARASFAPMWEVWALLPTGLFETNFTNDDLAEGAINGMLDVLNDPNTRYLSPQEETAAREGFSGELQGIGAEVTMVDDFVTIVSPLEGSPAEAAGLRPGDVLLAADGISLIGIDISTAVSYVRGPAGTTVTLLVQRDGEQFSVDIVRDIIRVPSVRGEMLPEGLAYVRLNRFGQNTTAELQATLDELLAQEPAGLILDLRRNPGGSLETAVEVADEFLDRGVVLLERSARRGEEQYESTNAGRAQTIPMAVLIDEGTASASELVSGALQDRSRAVVIGVTSFGKGTVQTWHPLSNGGGVRITTARWLTPNGRWVSPDGLEPDIVVSLPETADENGEWPDTQLDAAIDYLLSSGG
jgi:carboxyl-terminal processing protease